MKTNGRNSQLDESRVIRDMLLLVGARVPLRIVRAWTADQLSQAETWAAKSILRANDNPVRVPKKPDFLNGGRK